MIRYKNDLKGQEMEGEGDDRSDLSLPGNQFLLLTDVLNHGCRRNAHLYGAQSN